MDKELNGWFLYSGESEAGTLVAHVVPAHDMREHELSSECWCDPELNEVDMIATHHSADGREAYEEKTRLLN